MASRNILWQAQKLNVRYGDRQVLFDVTLELGEGEVVCLLGHNGAGKSTLVKALYGLVPVESGSITFLGVEMAHASVSSRLSAGVAYMPEGRGVLRSLTVAENLRLGLAAAGVSKPERAARLDEVYDLLPILREFQDRPTDLLSGGQQQMLSLGRALLYRPRCLLLDEPSIGLAPKLFQDLMIAIESYRTRFGTAVILVEQNIQEALRIADRVYLMKAGRIVSEGEPEAYRDPQKLMKFY